MYLTVQSGESVAVLMEDGAFALFFRPHPEGLDSSRVFAPGEFAIQGKKMLMPGGQSEKGWGGWAQMEWTDGLMD